MVILKLQHFLCHVAGPTCPHLSNLMSKDSGVAAVRVGDLGTNGCCGESLGLIEAAAAAVVDGGGGEVDVVWEVGGGEATCELGKADLGPLFPRPETARDTRIPSTPIKTVARAPVRVQCGCLLSHAPGMGQ